MVLASEISKLQLRQIQDRTERPLKRTGTGKLLSGRYTQSTKRLRATKIEQRDGDDELEVELKWKGTEESGRRASEEEAPGHAPFLFSPQAPAMRDEKYR